jgi:hypothetical protein
VISDDAGVITDPVHSRYNGFAGKFVIEKGTRESVAGIQNQIRRIVVNDGCDFCDSAVDASRLNLPVKIIGMQNDDMSGGLRRQQE